MTSIPPFGGIDFDRWKPTVELAYPNRVVQQIAQLGDISNDDRIEGLQRQLHLWGIIYLQHKADQEELQNREKHKRTIAVIGKLAMQLQEKLSQLDKPEAELFWQSEEMLTRAIVPGYQTKSPFGHTVRWIAAPSNAHAPIYLRQFDHQESLTVLANYAKAAVDRVPKPLGGRPSLFALENWCTNVRNYRVKILRSDFTLSKSAGVYKSKAYSFCREAMRHLDPDVTESQLSSVMRTLIKEARANGQPR